MADGRERLAAEAVRPYPLQVLEGSQLGSREALREDGQIRFLSFFHFFIHSIVEYELQRNEWSDGRVRAG